MQITNFKKPTYYQITNERRVKFCPPSFATLKIERSYNLEKAIINWIEDNLSGRYYFGIDVTLDKDNKILSIFKVGFESHKEQSFFSLACPLLKYQ